MNKIKIWDIEIYKDWNSIIIKWDNWSIITSDYIFKDYIQNFYNRFNNK